MEQQGLEIGSIVRASYKSGEYIGEIVEETRTKVAVKVLAVLKHPAQGDLHHPMEVEGVMFHQRRALADQEIALMHRSTLMPYSREIPEYRASLLKALEEEMKLMHKMASWSSRALIELEKLQEDYGRA